MTTDDDHQTKYSTMPGYSAQNYRIALKQEYDVRDYCVQYLETDYDFVCRLMEEVGIYFFFEHEDGREELVLADDIIGAFQSARGGASFPIASPAGRHLLSKDHVFEWRSSRLATRTAYPTRTTISSFRRKNGD